jgi:sugar lactone lactonase YvrE
MYKLILSLFVLAAMALSAEPRFERFDDPGARLTASERELLDAWMEELVLFEDFSDNRIERLGGIDRTRIQDGALHIDRDGRHLYFELGRGFTRALVCYRVTSERGHLFTPIGSENGHYALFNDVLGDWAWKDFEHGQQTFREEGFGEPFASNRNRWMVHELRVENETLNYYVNNRLFGSVPFDRAKKMRNFAVAANAGGRGLVDYVLIAGKAVSDERVYTFGDIEIACSHGYEIEAVVPAGLTASAPFDTTITPKGEIVMAGSRGKLVKLVGDGRFETLGAPAGINFECTDEGVFWYYDFPGGRLYRWQPGSADAEDVARLPQAYTDGSVAASPDGQTVYVAWWIRDDDPGKEASALYKYTDQFGLQKLFDMPKDLFLRAVEVTPQGRIYLATTEGIDLLVGKRREPVYRRGNLHITSDGLTSDLAGNLYFTGYAGGEPGLYRLDTTGQCRLIAINPEDEAMPFGLSFHEPSQRVICVRKKSGELLAIAMDGTIQRLNDPSGLTTPIAVEQHPEGTLFVNGDEAGLLRIAPNGTVENFNRSHICSFQPPAADFAFDRDGSIYYSEAAPGFPSSILEIDSMGNQRTITREVGAPAGIEAAPDGALYYADYGKSAVMRLQANGTSTVVAKNIPYPVGLAVDKRGRIWVGAAEPDATGDPYSLDEVENTRILRITPGRQPEEVVKLEDGRRHRAFTFFDVDEQGNLYLPDGDRLLLRTNTGEIRVIAEGFDHLQGACVCRDGSIVVTDYGIAALYRLRRK